MATKLLKIIGLVLGGIVLIVLVGYLGFTIKSKRAASTYLSNLGPEAPMLLEEGKPFRDLNKNGKRDVYEDANESIENRVEDLISQMTIEEKAGSLFINMVGVNPDGSLM
jgi:beta-glucosidase